MTEEKDGLYFYKGKTNQVENTDLLKFYYEVDDSKAQTLTDADFQLIYIKNELKKALQIRNLSFFLGAGCSSYLDKDGQEIGIPVISGLTSKVYGELDEEDKNLISKTIKIDITTHPYLCNIEKTIEILQSYRFYLAGTSQDVSKVDALLLKIKQTIYKTCISRNDQVLDVYERFYRKVILREHSLNTLNLITSNYDLYSELALEKIGIQYCNGFSGFQERVFNPAIFNQIYAEDIGNKGKRLYPVQNYAYLLKLHGSVSWFESTDSAAGLYRTKEIRPKENNSDVNQLSELMIYPSPLKQNASLGSPYSDIFREFQKRIMVEENILVTIGYSFGDEHINNIIFQALSSPRFRLIVLGEIKGKIKDLCKLDDPRIWIVGGRLNGEKVHYLNNFTSSILSSHNSDLIQDKINKSALTLREFDPK